MKFKEPIVLFRTIVGSHMWGQHHSESDTDLFKCYVFDSRSFLLGNRHDGGHHSEDKEKNEETTSYEIGHVIRQLQKGNVNFLWGVMSPKVALFNTNINPNVWDLRKIVLDNLSKNYVHSIRGFAMHNLKHWFGLKVNKVLCMDGFTRYYVEKKKEPRLLPKDKKYYKILNTCARTLDFGIKLLRDGKVDFENPMGAVRPYNILHLLDKLEIAYEGSKLPERPNKESFEDFLLDIRRRENEL